MNLSEQEKQIERDINYEWNNLTYLQEYIMNNHLGIIPTSLMEAWRILFPSLYPLIVEVRNKLSFTALTHILEYKNSDYFLPRSTSYKTLNCFSAVVSKVEFYKSGVDVFYDLFDIDQLYTEKKALYILWCRNEKLDRVSRLNIDKYI